MCSISKSFLHKVNVLCLEEFPELLAVWRTWLSGTKNLLPEKHLPIYPSTPDSQRYINPVCPLKLPAFIYRLKLQILSVSGVYLPYFLITHCNAKHNLLLDVAFDAVLWGLMKSSIAGGLRMSSLGTSSSNLSPQIDRRTLLSIAIWDCSLNSSNA